MVVDASEGIADPSVERDLVSVIIPCWNAETTIERAVGSVLVDHGVPLEVVVIDDGSTDATGRAVETIQRRDDRVRLVRSPANEGVSEARNRGLDAARGAWLAFLDADDRYFGGGLLAMWAAALERDALAVVGQRVWSDGRRTWISRFYDIPDIRTPGRKSLARHPGLLYYASTTGKLFHRSCVAGLRFHGRVLGDQPWTIRALLRAGDRIEVIADDVYEWTRTAPGGASHSITRDTRSVFGLEPVAIATEALAAVRAEAADVVADPAARELIGATYVGRLLRSDLGVHLANAIRRRDPMTGELLAAIGRFLATVEPAALAATDALAEDILEPPLRAWDAFPASARPAYWQLLGEAAERDPRLPSRARRRATRLALWVAIHLPHSVGRPLASLVLEGRRIVSLARRITGRPRSRRG